MSINTVFLFGVLIFAATSVYFWVEDQGKEFNSPLLVTAITAASYLLMLEGGLALQQADGAIIHWTRWVGYSMSCSLLFYVVASGINSFQRRVSLSALMGLVMLTGAFAAAWTGWFMWGGFVLSSFFFAVVLIELYQRSDKASLQPMHKYIWFGWAVFPVVFLLGPSGIYIMSAGVAAVIYLLLDVYTKIVFYFEMAQRRQRNGRGLISRIADLYQ